MSSLVGASNVAYTRYVVPYSDVAYSSTSIPAGPVGTKVPLHERHFDIVNGIAESVVAGIA